MRPAVILLIFGLLLGSLARSQSHTVKLNGGLEAEVLSIGRSSDHQNLTISMRLSNKGKSTAYVLMVGFPMITDNTGAAFDGVNGSVSGVARCTAHINYCAGIPEVHERYTVPLRSYTEIDPGVGIVLNMSFHSASSKGPLISFSVDLAYRLTNDVLRDETLPDADKYKQIHMMTLSIPPMQVTEGK